MRQRTLQQFSEDVEKTLVVALRAEAHAQRPGPAEGAAGADDDVALTQPADDLRFVGVVGEVEPHEVRLRVGDLHPEVREALLDVQPRDDRALDALGDGVGVAKGLDGRRLGGTLTKKGWRTWLTAATKSSEPHRPKPTRSPARP